MHYWMSKESTIPFLNGKTWVSKNSHGYFYTKHTALKMKFLNKDLVKYTEQILNGKLIFCAVTSFGMDLGFFLTPGAISIVPWKSTTVGLSVVIAVHFLKSVQIRSHFWSVFSPNAGKYRPEIIPHLDTVHTVVSSEGNWNSDNWFLFSMFEYYLMLFNTFDTFQTFIWRRFILSHAIILTSVDKQTMTLWIF